MSQNVQDLIKEVSSLKKQVAMLVNIMTPLARNYKPKEDMTGEEVMAELHISESTLGKLRRSGVLIGYTSTGRNFYYKRTEVEDYKSGKKATQIFFHKQKLISQ